MSVTAARPASAVPSLPAAHVASFTQKVPVCAQLFSPSLASSWLLIFTNSAAVHSVAPCALQMASASANVAVPFAHMGLPHVVAVGSLYAQPSVRPPAHQSSSQ